MDKIERRTTPKRVPERPFRVNWAYTAEGAQVVEIVDLMTGENSTTTVAELELRSDLARAAHPGTRGVADDILEVLSPGRWESLSRGRSRAAEVLGRSSGVTVSERVEGPIRREMSPDATCAILAEVAAERRRQDERWGRQDHLWYSSDADSAAPSRADVWRIVETRSREGTLRWADILLEEVAEAVNEPDDRHARAELVQVAAVAVAAIEAIDRRAKVGQ